LVTKTVSLDHILFWILSLKSTVIVVPSIENDIAILEESLLPRVNKGFLISSKSSKDENYGILS